MRRGLVVALAALALPAAAAADDEARTVAVCTSSAAGELRVRADDGRLELRFVLRTRRAAGLWRVGLVHERRLVWRGEARPRGSARAFELRRRLDDLPGSDEVAVTAWGPRGAMCRAAVRLG
jgi:hypothetical protein